MLRREPVEGEMRCGGGGGGGELSSEDERVCSQTQLDLRISFLDKKCARKASTRESEVIVEDPG